MTTMLEMAAIAASEAAETVPVEQQGAREGWLMVARAVLMAVRSPDGNVVDAGRPHMPAEAEFAIREIGGEYNRRYHHFVRTRPPHECVSPAGPFTAMIDAILNERAE